MSVQNYSQLFRYVNDIQTFGSTRIVFSLSFFARNCTFFQSVRPAPDFLERTFQKKQSLVHLCMQPNVYF